MIKSRLLMPEALRGFPRAQPDSRHGLPDRIPHVARLEIPEVCQPDALRNLQRASTCFSRAARWTAPVQVLVGPTGLTNVQSVSLVSWLVRVFHASFST